MDRKNKVRINLVASDRSESLSSVSEIQNMKKTTKVADKKSSKEPTSTKSKPPNQTVAKPQKTTGVKTSSKSVVKDSLVVVNKPSTSTSKVMSITNKPKIVNRSENRTKPIANPKINNKELLGLNSPRLKYVRPPGEGQSRNIGVKNKTLNVTVHSPPRGDSNRKVLNNNQFDEEKAMGSSIEDLSIKHTRHRTRTLEPSEVKVLKKEDKSLNEKGIEKLSNVIKSDLQKMPITKSEAFYVPLEQKFNVPIQKTKSPIDIDHNSDSYEEDFESYESDFESFVSSHNDSSSEKSSLHEDYEENLRADVNSDVLIEADLDSGNYDLKVDSKVEDSRNDSELDKIPYPFLKTRDVGSAKMPSYTDEGFDENSGGFSSTSNSANVKFDDSPKKSMENQNDSLLFALKHARNLKHKMNYYQQRARDLSGLITFDNVEYSLFEIRPIPYDVFIKTYGKSNVSQKFCQTNDDYIDDSTQTDVILSQSKWSQFPVNYSNFDIAIVKNDKQKKTVSVENVYQDIDLSERSRVISQTEMKTINNPIDVYRSQRLGCSLDQNTNISSATSFYSDQKQYKKLYNFVDKVGKAMLRYLKETSSRNALVQETIKSEYSFSKYFTKPLQDSVRYLKNRPPILMSVCSNNIDLFLTVHEKCKNLEGSIEDMIFSRSLICIWDLSYSKKEPAMVLLSVDNISSCKFYNGLNGFVIAGTKDGVTCFWDLEEHEMWHHLIQSTIKDQSAADDLKLNIDHLVVRCCTFSSFSIDFEQVFQNYYGSVVEILIDQFEKDSITKTIDSGSYNQVCVLQEYGMLTIWTVIKSKAMVMNQFSNTDVFANQSTQSYWSNMKFYKHLVLNLQEPFKHVSTLDNSVLEMKFFKKSFSHQEFPLTNVKRKNSYKQTMTPRGVNDDQDDSLKSIKRNNLASSESPQSEHNSLSLELLSPIYEWESKLICSTLKFLVDPNGLQHFLFACSSGCIFHYDQRGNMLNPQVYVSSNTTSFIRCIEICSHDRLFFLAGSDNCVNLFSMSNPKPLKSFFNESGSVENFSRFYKEEIICIEWSKLRPCLFFTLSDRSCLTVWDLLKSDLVPISTEVLGVDDFVTSIKLLIDEKQTPMMEYLVLFHKSGNIEKHILSSDLMTSIHPNKDVEATVLGRYMKLL